MKVVQSFLDIGNTVIVVHTKAEQKQHEIKAYAAMYEEDETGTLTPFSFFSSDRRVANFDTRKEAFRFLHRLHYFFDQYKSKDYARLHGALR